MARYKLTLRCNNFRHGPHKYSKEVSVDEAGGETLADVPNPPCPLCRKLIKVRDTEPMATAPIPIKPVEEWLPTGQAPAQIGKNNTVKAIDMAADIAMKDYGLSDLKDNVRQGDVMAPPLAPQQQKLADHFFNPQENPALSAQRKKQIARLGQRAIAGAFRNQALDVKSVLPDNRVGLRPYRTEIVNAPRK
jgi:hypothetical protein